MNTPRKPDLIVRTLDPLCAYGNFTGVVRHEIDAETAEYRLRVHGIKPTLLPYLQAIFAHARTWP